MNRPPISLRYYRYSDDRFRRCCGYHFLKAKVLMAIDFMKSFKAPCTENHRKCEQRRAYYRLLKIRMSSILESEHKLKEMYRKVNFNHNEAFFKRRYIRKFTERWNNCHVMLENLLRFANRYEQKMDHQPFYQHRLDLTSLSVHIQLIYCRGRWI